jgi:hypothetical protein
MQPRSYLSMGLCMETGVGTCIFSTTSLSTALPPMPSICAGMAIVRDEKDYAGRELPITLRMSQILYGNYPSAQVSELTGVPH